MKLWERMFACEGVSPRRATSQMIPSNTAIAPNPIPSTRLTRRSLWDLTKRSSPNTRENRDRKDHRRQGENPVDPGDGAVQERHEGRTTEGSITTATERGAHLQPPPTQAGSVAASTSTVTPTYRRSPHRQKARTIGCAQWQAVEALEDEVEQLFGWQTLREQGPVPRRCGWTPAEVGVPGQDERRCKGRASIPKALSRLRAG